MSSPYDRYDRASSRRRGVWSHWVPLVVTVTVATVGLAAWVWSQRKTDEEEEGEMEHEPGLDYENADYGDNPAYGADYGDNPAYGANSSEGVGPPPSRDPQQQAPIPPAAAAAATAGGAAGANLTAVPPADVPGASWGARMTGALRAPSPKQIMDSASKTVAAGVAAAGVAATKALASIREEDKAAYADHDAWSEEAGKTKEPGGAKPKDDAKRRKSVAIVISADNHADDIDEDGFHEHAVWLWSVRWHNLDVERYNYAVYPEPYPRHIDFSKTKLFIFIYAPALKEPVVEPSTTQTPGEESKSPTMNPATSSPAYNAVYSQALALVENQQMVLPFTTPSGHTHMLRVIQPDIVYLQESLSGDNGAIVTQLQTWMRQDIILIVGAETGSGGLADSESEAEKTEKDVKWWQRPERVGRGRGVVVVDGMRVADDWARRVQGRD